MPTLQELQQASADALVAAQADGQRLGYAAAVADFFGQNAAFLLANIFADSLEGAAGRLASHDQGFATKMHQFAQALRDSVNQPTVTITSPTPNASAPGTSITVKFSEDMDPATVVPASFTVVPAGKAAVGVTVAYNTQTRTATLTPASAFTAGDVVLVTVGSVRNTQGVAMGSPYQWTFTATAPALAEAPRRASAKKS